MYSPSRALPRTPRTRAAVVDGGPAVAAAADQLLGGLRPPAPPVRRPSPGAPAALPPASPYAPVKSASADCAPAAVAAEPPGVRTSSPQAPVAAPVARTLAKTNVRAAPRRNAGGSPVFVGGLSGIPRARHVGESRPDEGAARAVDRTAPAACVTPSDTCAARRTRPRAGISDADRDEQRKHREHRVPADEVDQMRSCPAEPGVVDEEVLADRAAVRRRRPPPIRPAIAASRMNGIWM